MKKLLLSMFALMAAAVGAQADDAVYKLVEDANQLDVNKQVIIVAATSDKAMSTTQNSNNRAATDITRSTDGKTITNPSSSVQVFTLEAGSVTNTYAFNTGSGYIYAASSSKNYLKTETSIDANASATITISTTATSIVFRGNNSHNTLQYNGSNNNDLFSCYASASASQENVVLYVLQENDGLIDPEASFSAESYNFDCGTSEIFYAPKLNTNSDGVVTYSVSPSSTATINATGTEVTIAEAGVYTVTATIAKSDTYNSAKVSYTIVATSSLIGGTTTKIFNFNENDYGMTHDTSNSYSNVGESFALDEVVTLTVGTNCRYFVSQGVTTFRIGKDQSSTLSVPEGVLITNVEFAPASNGITISEMPARVVTISNSGNAFAFNSFTVTYTDGSPLKQPITINSAGIATFCTKNALDFTDLDGITAYVAKAADASTVTLSKVDGEVPGNTGLIIMGETTDVPVIASTTNTIATNLLKPAFNGATIEASLGTNSRYVFGKLPGETSPAFHLLETNMVSSGNRAYLEVTGGSATNAPARRTIVFEGTDDIETIELDAETFDAIFNIVGQQVNDNYKGFVIKNGKKQINK